MAKSRGYIKIYRWQTGELPNDGALTADEIEERKSRGYFKLYRDIMETDLASNPRLLMLFVWLLNISNWKTTKARFAGKYQEILPGQSITGYRDLAASLGTTPKTIRKHLDYLQETGRITVESDTHGTRVTVCKWSEYQGEENQTETLGITRGTTRGYTRGNTTIEEDKNIRSEEVDCSELEQKRSSTGAVEELRGTLLVEGKLQTVSQDLQRAWLAAYPEAEWIKSEIAKASAWIEANPRKRPKNFGRFMGGWLSRGWEQYRKTLPSQPVPVVSQSAQRKAADEAYEREYAAAKLQAEEDARRAGIL